MITHEELLRAREVLLDRTVSFFAAQADVIGIILAGSIPAGAADAYSDIDLRVVATMEGQVRLRAGRLEWPSQWGDLLFNGVFFAQSLLEELREFTIRLDLWLVGWQPAADILTTRQRPPRLAPD